MENKVWEVGDFEHLPPTHPLSPISLANSPFYSFVLSDLAFE